ncbi:MAG: ATP synthase subunit I [Cyanobacteria bacterium J06582_2]
MSSNQLETTPNAEESQDSVEAPELAGDSMDEYYQLKQSLLMVTLIITAFIFVSVWIAYSFNTALNYLLGACVGIVYLGMLAREVERIGASKKGVGSTRLALLAGVIIVATQLQQLQVIPIFLGFLTYKAAIIFYVLQTTLMPAKK